MARCDTGKARGEGWPSTATLPLASLACGQAIQHDLWLTAVIDRGRDLGEGANGVASGNLTGTDPTQRQMDILARVASGDDYLRIGHDLYISGRTVRREISRLKVLTGTNSTAELVATAIMRSWLTFGSAAGEKAS
ncbi:hypothetical protein KGQ20_02640 [Catenulispora sp. NF23]|uniref:hypothetical protein n=1 Tax=Catenulispora pinistramenti TaxID=2705254 RepID=UPI001BAD2E5D|nr:hypothetical protein [Catenulispora pinistramenti]MBS2531663.1 hypothetical protein [Catenulispora pinistramenti]